MKRGKYEPGGFAERVKIEDKIKVKVKCYCGNVFLTYEASIRKKHTRSCGCLLKQNKGTPKTHGLTYSPLWNTWNSMKDRCLNPNHQAYYLYGQRGIKIDEKWTNSFEQFYADMKDAHFPKAVLDRIDTNGNYCKENCRWITQKENCRNSRANVSIESIPLYFIKDLCLKHSIEYPNIYQKLHKGVSIKEMLKKPVKGKQDLWPLFKNEMQKLYDTYNLKLDRIFESEE